MNLYMFPWEIFTVLLLLGVGLAIGSALTRGPSARRLRLAALLCIGLGVALFGGAAALGIPLNLTGEPMITSMDAPAPLRSRVYTVAPANDIYREGVNAANFQRSWFGMWRVVSQRTTPISGGQLQVNIPNLGATDVLSANIRPEELGVQVDAQARSSLGILSFGAPRRYLAQYLGALDARVAQTWPEN
jgi:hypothetical protein